MLLNAILGADMHGHTMQQLLQPPQSTVIRAYLFIHQTTTTAVMTRFGRPGPGCKMCREEQK